MTGPIMIDVDGLMLSAEDRELLVHPLTGGVILFARNFHTREQIRALISDIRDSSRASKSSRSVIVAVDQEGGRVQRFRESFVKMPPMAACGQVYDTNPERGCQLAEDLGWLLACELRDIDVDLNFAPVLDLDYGCSEVIGDRAFHRDPAAVSELACALISGLHSGGVTACAKHFPGHGAVHGDSHTELPHDHRTRGEIDRDLIPFQRVIQRGVESVMTAHVVAHCEDSEPVSFSARWLGQILRRECQFGGVIFSDDLSMRGADCAGGIEEKVTRALAAGCEFLPICNDREAVRALYSSDYNVSETRSFETLIARKGNVESYDKTNRYKEIVETISRLNESEAERQSLKAE